MHSYSDSLSCRAALVPDGPAQWLLPIKGRQPVRFVANDAILAGFDAKVFEQAVNTAEAPGVEQLIVLSDSHAGYGCPVGSVVVTDGMMYPGPVGPDIGCSMSYLQTDVPEEATTDKATRRAILNAITERIPTGTGSRQAPKAHRFSDDSLRKAATHGATDSVLESLGIPVEWGSRVECGRNGDPGVLTARLATHESRILAKLLQVGSLGAGNHFISGQIPTVISGMEWLAEQWGIKSGHFGMLTHCGSRGFGFQLAGLHFKGLAARFAEWGIPLPGGEKELVYAPVDSHEGQAYMSDMYLGANFATVNHLLLNTYLLEAIQEVLPGARGELVYHIAHNIGREEIVKGRKRWVFRKGSTRAFPSGHHDLKDTPYAATGHPILVPGNPEAGSVIMVARDGASQTAYSINHGAGRAMGRKAAKRALNQATVDAGMLAADILFNGRSYPIDEAPAAYKDFEQVNASIEMAGLASPVARLRERFVLKDSDQSAEGAA